MAKITIDGCEFEVQAGDNLLAVALNAGLSLPYFCWHPALGSVGACRQCAVKQYRNADDKHGKLVMACMVPVEDGARFSIEDAEAGAFRKAVIEWLMVNHPHDCPVCDEGGECHLQDMTVMTGHVYRRYRFGKRTHRNQDLGPFVAHEMNRCIACYRCVRFYNDYAGGTDLRAFAGKNHVWFGRACSGALENPFAGNLVEVCPTGVFTDKTLARHFTRKWDLQSAPSVCPHCGIGCNTFAAERYGTLRRIVNRYHPEINSYFLCDRGRFGYEHVNGPQRLKAVQVRKTRADVLSPGSMAEVLARLGDGGGMVGIGSPRTSLENNFALRTLVGADNFSSGFSRHEHVLASLIADRLRAPVASPWSLREAEQADAVVIIGEDVETTAPRLALALRQALRLPAFEYAQTLHVPLWQDASVRDAASGRKAPLFIIGPMPTSLDGVATRVWRLPPEDTALFVQAVAGLLSPAAPRVPPLPAAFADDAKILAQVLAGAQRPVVIGGTSLGSPAVIEAAANLAHALPQTTKGWVATVPETNTAGVALLGGRPIEDVLGAMDDGQADTVLVLENDLFRRLHKNQLDASLAKVRTVVVLDAIMHPTAARADVLLPVASFAEASGTVVNYEGRAQRRLAAFSVAGDVRAAWRYLTEIGNALGRNMDWRTLDEVLAAMGEALPLLAPARQGAPLAMHREAWQPVPRQPPRYSGRTAMFAGRTLFEPPPPEDPDAPLAYSMEGFDGQPQAALHPRYWQPGWNSQQAMIFYQREINGPLRTGTAGVRLFADGAVESSWYPLPKSDGVPLQAVPVYHVFGSEELSALAQGVASLAPAPYALAHPSDAQAAGFAEGEPIAVTIADQTLVLPLRFGPMARGVIGLSAGIAPVLGLALPAPITWSKAP